MTRDILKRKFDRQRWHETIERLFDKWQATVVMTHKILQMTFYSVTVNTSFCRLSQMLPNTPETHTFLYVYSFMLELNNGSKMLRSRDVLASSHANAHSVFNASHSDVTVPVWSPKSISILPACLGGVCHVQNTNSRDYKLRWVHMFFWKETYRKHSSCCWQSSHLQEALNSSSLKWLKRLLKAFSRNHWKNRWIKTPCPAKAYFRIMSGHQKRKVILLLIKTPVIIFWICVGFLFLAILFIK